MNFVSAIVLIAAASSVNEPIDYKTAYHRAMKGDKPLLVLVTADWCSPCQVMKRTTIPTMLSQNKFKDFHFATVDVDKQTKIARQLVKSRGVPQLIIFEKKKGVWMTRNLPGVQSVASVESFLDKSLSTRTAQADHSRLSH